MKRASSAQYATPPADAHMHVEDLTGRDARWINRAIGVAYTSTHPIQMGAVAISGGSLLASGVNRYRNSPAIAVDWDACSVHAEAALARGRDLTGATVYVARARRDGDTALAKPCKACLSTLTAAGVKRVIWTMDGERVGRMALG